MKNYFLNSEPASSITHLIGALLSVAALVLLIVFAAKNANAWHIVSFAIFGSALILLYLASTAYHAVPKKNKHKILFRKIDLSMIFVLIAGTYTPIALVPLRGFWGWCLLGIIWGIAIFGITAQITKINFKSWHFTLAYVLSGWLIIAMLPLLLNSLPGLGILWLVIGGLCYTVGVIFFSLDNKIKRNAWFGMHEIFHLFVIAGSFSHFWLMLQYVIYIN